MLDPKFIRENVDKVKENTKQRGPDPKVVDEFLAADKAKLDLLKEFEDLNRRKNEIAEMLKDAAKRTPEVIEEGKKLKTQAAEIEEKLKAAELTWNDAISKVPNIHLSQVPIGKSDAENVVVRVVGEVPKFDFEPKDHIQIGKDLDMIDFDWGAKVAGSQFYYLKNDAVLLDLALQQFAMNYLAGKGFTMVMTPDVAGSRYYLGTGYSPRGSEAQTYEVDGEDLGLIATAEVTMAGVYADEVIPEEELPKKYVAVSHCFRKEAGAYGKYSKGLYRVHQFTKVEMFIYCKPEESEAMHALILQMEEEVAQALGLPYRVVEMCSGDLGAMAARKFDLEAWMPGRNDYGEITSTSNCTDFQARNLNIRYKNKEGKVDYLHMLNGTAVVLSRFPLAILENYQQKDGTVKVPEVLVKYVGKEFLGKK